MHADLLTNCKGEEEKKLINDKRIATRRANQALMVQRKLPAPKKVSVIQGIPGRPYKVAPKTLNQYLQEASAIVQDPAPLYTPVYSTQEPLDVEFGLASSSSVDNGQPDMVLWKLRIRKL